MNSLATPTLQQPLVVPLTEQEAKQAQRRRAFSAGAVFIACVLWYLTLEKLQAAGEGLPWYITSGLIAVLCALNVARPRPAEFKFNAATYKREPLTLLETWSLAYFACAVLLYAWVLMHGVFTPVHRPARQIHIVDIQLTSASDYADRQSPMPGTEVKEQLHKRRSDLTTSQGAISANKLAAPVKKNLERVVEEKTKPLPPVQAKLPILIRQKALPTAEKQVPLPAERADTLFVKPMTLVQQAQPPVQEKQTRKAPSAQVAYLEEVQPPEMVEMIENDGVSEATHVFEEGGSSTGGNGAKSELSVYMKDLHKRIKGAWSPPRGQSRKVRVLFRVRKDGQLAFIKITRSSGDNETDAAALRAITTAVKKRELPHTYALPYLDVQYTFNYTADEIKEIKVNDD